MKNLFIALIVWLTCSVSLAQDDRTVWTDGVYIECSSETYLPYDQEVTVLIVDCGKDVRGLFASLENNPQIAELQLTHVDQALLNAVFQLKSTALTTLTITDFQSRACNIPACSIPTLTQFHIQSDNTQELEFAPQAFAALDILQVAMNAVTKWNGELSVPTLGLADITCKKLEQLPVLVTPQLYQYSLTTAAPFPTDICTMPELTLVYISTTGDSKLSSCHRELMKREGLMEFVTFADDEEKRTAIKSQSTLDFEKEMEQKASEELQEMQQD